VVVNVNEARRNNQSVRVNHTLVSSRFEFSDFFDLVANNPHIGRSPWHTRAVNQRSARNQN
jgi:hypothetical protein